MKMELLLQRPFFHKAYLLRNKQEKRINLENQSQLSMEHSKIQMYLIKILNKIIKVMKIRIVKTTIWKICLVTFKKNFNCKTRESRI